MSKKRRSADEPSVFRKLAREIEKEKDPLDAVKVLSEQTLETCSAILAEMNLDLGASLLVQMLAYSEASPEDANEDLREVIEKFRLLVSYTKVHNPDLFERAQQMLRAIEATPDE